VTSLADAGTGSLRDAITRANNSPDAFSSIDFAAGLNGTISLATALPALARSVSLHGPGARTITVARSSAAGTPAFGIFTVKPGVTATIVGLTLANGSAADGGGIDNQGFLVLRDARVTRNTATDRGGIFSNPSAVTGGVNIFNSLIDGNTTAGGGGAAGIDNEAAFLLLQNSTVTGNQSTASSNAGGVAVNGGLANISNSTIALNTATGPVNAGGLDVAAGGTADVQSTLVARNLGSGPGPDVRGNVNSQGNNLIGDGTGAANLVNGQNGDQVGPTGGHAIDPLLGLLQDNGGATRTLALQPGSPAIGQGGTPPSSQDLPADQRSLQRVVNNALEVGAFQSGATLIGTQMFLDSTSGSSPPGGQPISFFVTAGPAVTGATAALAGGFVQLSVDGHVAGTSRVTNGVATLPLPGGLSAGRHTVLATYLGDGTFAPAAVTLPLVATPPSPVTHPNEGGGGTPPPVPLTSDVTSQVGVRLTAAPHARKGKGRGLTRTLTIVNNSGQVLQGPLDVVLRGLNRKSKLQGAAGSVGSRKSKSPFLVLNIDSLPPGGSVSSTLRFGGKPNRFTLAVFAGTSPR
jgi:hypothetical protein